MGGIRKFLACERGVSAMEYGLIVALVSAATLAAMSELGGTLFSGTDAKLANAVDSITPAAGE